MLIRLMSRWWGDFEEKYGTWSKEPIVGISGFLSMGYWIPFFMVLYPPHHLPGSNFLVMPTIYAMIVGFILSAFNNVKERGNRLWALGLHTIFLPGFLALLAIIATIAGGWHFLKALLKFQDGLLFIQDMLNGGIYKKWQSRRERKRLEQDTKLKAIANSVRVSGEGYRMPYASCKECGQVMPENEIENDRSHIRHASG